MAPIYRDAPMGQAALHSAESHQHPSAAADGRQQRTQPLPETGARIRSRKAPPRALPGCHILTGTIHVCSCQWAQKTCGHRSGQGRGPARIHSRPPPHSWQCPCYTIMLKVYPSSCHPLPPQPLGLCGEGGLAGLPAPLWSPLGDSWCVFLHMPLGGGGDWVACPCP